MIKAYARKPLSFYRAKRIYHFTIFTLKSTSHNKNPVYAVNPHFSGTYGNCI